MFRYSVTQWIFGNEEIEKSLTRLKKFNYDGVELAGEPYKLDTKIIKKLLSEYQLVCTSICGIFTPERDLSSSKSEIRTNAVKYLKDCVDMAVELGATHIIVVPSPVGKLSPDNTVEEAWEKAVESVREAGEYARSQNINFAIEALNRYETYLINNLAMALKFVKEVNVSSVKIMADLFHMNIEERNNCDAIRKVSEYLVHVHIADNTREAAGVGKINFAEVIQTLKEINYQGPITMEFLPSVSNPYAAAEFEEKGDDIFDSFTEQSINHIKKLEALM